MNIDEFIELSIVGYGRVGGVEEMSPRVHPLKIFMKNSYFRILWVIHEIILFWF